RTCLEFAASLLSRHRCCFGPDIPPHRSPGPILGNKYFKLEFWRTQLRWRERGALLRKLDAQAMAHREASSTAGQRRSRKLLESRDGTPRIQAMENLHI
ncbi:hypothetical protein NL676_008273, partial [Syzygium grande]